MEEHFSFPSPPSHGRILAAHLLFSPSERLDLQSSWARCYKPWGCPLNRTFRSCLWPSHQSQGWPPESSFIYKLSKWLLSKLNSKVYCSRDYHPCAATKRFSGPSPLPRILLIFSFCFPFFWFCQCKNLRDSSLLPLCDSFLPVDVVTLL